MADTAVPDIELSDCHKKELAFNRDKLQLAKVEAHLAGHLVDSETTPDVAQTSVEHAQILHKAQARRLQDQKRHHAVACKKSVSIRGRHIFFLTDTALRPLGRFGGVLARSRGTADLIVVRDPAAASIRTTLVAGLVGASLVTKEYVETNGARGAAVAFKPAVKIRRWVHFLRQFHDAELGHLRGHPRDIDVTKNVSGNW